jgi:PAS domain S-box-containing protein
MAKVMVVDDEFIVTMEIKMGLTAQGHEVVGTASSGEQAVEMAQRLSPDVILMDIVMPGKLNGIAAAEIIKKELDIPVIFLTAHAEEPMIKRAKAVEPFGYIVKPYLESEIMATVEVALHKKDMERRLRESEERFRAIFETARDCIFIKDRFLRYTHVNPAVERLFESPASKLIGRTDAELFGEEAGAHLTEVDSRVLGGEVIEQEHSKPIKAVSVVFDVVKVPLHNAAGQIVGLCGIARDITERKRTEEQIEASLKEKEVLLREIHHRVKNNLAVISSMLDLQARRIEDERLKAAFQESQTRISSMGFIHETLYQSENLAAINLKQYVSGLVKSLSGIYGAAAARIAVRVEAEDTSLGIDQSVPCGLLINELTTNAFKHAFPDGGPGEVRIEARSASDNEIILIISDNGVGLSEDIDLRKTETLGLLLVTTLVDDQLKGTLEVSREKGTQFTIRFKKAP